MEAFEAAGIAVYALSYDEADALRDFRDAHGISYTLLSDPDSAVIASFGILNTLINEDDHPWYGIPYPGTYVVGTDGDITQKFFDSNLAVRAGAEQLLRAALGEEVGARAQTADASADEIEIDIAVDAKALTTTVQKDLVVRFRVPTGRHVYADPAPEGSVAVDVVLDENPSLVARPIVRPVAEPHVLIGTDETFDVHHGEFELRLPLTVNSAARPDPDTVTIAGEVRWQACDDHVCDIPESRRFELEVVVIAPPLRAIGDDRGAALEPRAMAHFQQMTKRRQS